MRLAATPDSAFVRIAAGAVLLVLAACTPGEASPSAQPQGSAQLKLMLGYNCAQTVIIGRYSCARSLDRQAQRDAAASAPRTCRSCGPGSTN